MKKRIISLLLAITMVFSMVPSMTYEADASVGSILSVALKVGKSVVSGAITTAEHSDQYDGFADAMVATWKNMAADLTGLDIGDDYDDDEDVGDDDEGTTEETDYNVYIDADLSVLEEQLKTINDAVTENSAAIHQLESTIVTEMSSISDKIDALSKKLDTQTQILQYDNYLDTFFEFFNQYLEGLSYYDNKMSYVLSGKATEAYVKKTYDQFYELEGREYTGTLHSAVDKLGRYIRGDYMSQYSSGIVDILSQYYILGYENAGYSTEAARQLAAETLESTVSYIYYVYCMGIYYESVIADYQLLYMQDHEADDYNVSSSEMLLAEEIINNNVAVCTGVQPTVACILNDLLNNYDNETVPYLCVSPSWLGTCYADLSGFTFDGGIEENYTLYLPDPCEYLSSDFSKEFRESFAGTMEYATGDHLSSLNSMYGYVEVPDGTSFDGTIVWIQSARMVYSFTLNLTAPDCGVFQTISVTNTRTLSGEGTAENPYRIFDVDDLKKISNAPDAYYTVVNDIDCDGAVLTPIENFSGCIYGNGFTISNFSVDLDRPSTAVSGYKAVGFIGVLTGTVSNLLISNATIANNQSPDNFLNLASDTYSIGTIAGLVSDGRIEYCSVDGSSLLIRSATHTCVGGIAGCLIDGGEIYACNIDGFKAVCIEMDVGKYNEVGGVVGRIDNGSVELTVVGTYTEAEDVTCVAEALTYTIESGVESDNAAKTTSSGLIAGNVVNGIISDSLVSDQAALLNNSAYPEGFHSYIYYSNGVKPGKYGIIAGRCGNNGNIDSVAAYGTNDCSYSLVGEGSTPNTLTNLSVSECYEKIIKQPEGSVNPFVYNQEAGIITLHRGMCIVGDYKSDYSIDDCTVRGTKYDVYDKLYWNLSGMALYYYVGEGNIVAPVKYAHIAESEADSSEAAYDTLVRMKLISEGGGSKRLVSLSPTFTFYDRDSADTNNSVTFTLSANLSHTYVWTCESKWFSEYGCGGDIYCYICAGCGHGTGRVQNAITHNFVIVEGYAATCTEDGLSDARYCANGCPARPAQELPYEQKVIPALGHDYVETTVPETCTEAGYTLYTCSRCGDTYKVYSETIAPHAWETITVLNPTCTASGMTQQKCKTCGTYGDFESVAPTGHDYKETVTAATCTTPGYTVHTCNTCGDSYTDNYAAPTGHSYDDGTVTKAATCTEEGEMAYKCSCGDTHTEPIPKIAHDYKETVVAPTCEDMGYTEHKCACGESYRDNYTAPTGHVYDDGTVTKEATCTQEGEMTYTCSCGDSHTEPIAKLAHDYQETVVAPTCETMGYTEHKCACGESYKDSYTAPTGHTYGDGTVTKAATCTQEGEMTYKCACGKTETAVISKLGHDWDEGTITLAPSITAEGKLEQHCSRCAEVQTSVLPKLEGCDDKNCPSDRFTDVQERTNWSHAGIDYMLQLGLFKGMSQTTFEPDTAVTRAMLVTVLYRYEGQPEISGNGGFTDVSTGRYYSDAVAWASENGIVLGMGDGTFDPEGEVTRQQIAVILYRYAQFKGVDVSVDENIDLTGYQDAAEVSRYAVTAMTWATQTGLINGVPVQGSMYLQPRESATRAQVCTILMRYIKNCMG